MENTYSDPDVIVPDSGTAPTEEQTDPVSDIARKLSTTGPGPDRQVDDSSKADDRGVYKLEASPVTDAERNDVMKRREAHKAELERQRQETSELRTVPEHDNTVGKSPLQVLVDAHEANTGKPITTPEPQLVPEPAVPVI